MIIKIHGAFKSKRFLFLLLMLLSIVVYTQNGSISA